MKAIFMAALAATIPAIAAAQPRAVPFEFRGNQIYLKVGIGDAPPRWFILDSGASGCVVDKTLARRLHLKTEGSIQGTGAGRGTVEMKPLPNLTYRVGGLQFRVAKSYAIDFSGQRAVLGRDLAGILGYDFFARYVVALDFKTEIMTLTDPAAYTGSGETIPITLEKHTPHISVRLKVGDQTVEHVLLVDSGSQDAVDDDSYANAPQKLEIVGGVGLGQEFRTTIARADWAEIGHFRLNGPLGATGGVPLIGLEVLRRFDVAFDYAHARMFLKPNEDFSESFAMDASGLDLRWTDDLARFAVHDVAKDTPAAEAGLKQGDEIAAIDGQAARNFRIDQIQRLLSEDGRDVTLRLKDGRTATLRLRKRL